jgi:hypothetical protein
MSLGKLLGAGKSFVSGGKAAAYRADKRVYLPKFGSQKNPFATMAQGELPKPPVEDSIASVKKAATRTWAKTQKMPTVFARPARATTWTEKFNPLSIWRGSTAEVKSSPRPVQAELSLEKVKVVHNDLSDVDVEIVPIKSRSVREISEPVFQAAVSVDADKNFWSRLDEKFFGANAI